MIFTNTNAMELLKEFAESDDSVVNPIAVDIDTTDAQNIMDMIPEVDPEDVDDIKDGGVNVETVRITASPSTGKYYMELAELVRLAESEKCDLTDAVELVLNHYANIEKEDFVVTIPDADMQKTIKEAAEGDTNAMHTLRNGSDLLRNVINKGLPVRKIVSND